MKNLPFQFFILFIVTSCFSFAGEKEKYWLFFADKGPALQKVSLEQLEAQLDERVKWRRAKVKSAGEPLVDFTDLPVYQPYINELAARDLAVIVTSKWLNAVSVHISAEEAQKLAALPFIRHIQKVMRGKRKPSIDDAENFAKPFGSMSTAVFDYGPSITQNQQIRIPDVHAAGVTGEGVLIAVLDTGYNLDNQVFREIDILDAFDFINNDDNVDNEAGDPYDENDHGTKVLSIIGGYAPGNLIGPAFKSSYLLAKTEDVSSETQVEEDYWIAAAEWAEERGADIITTSLGYVDWYDYDEMNGQTAKITIAADMAVDKGVVVVTSAGNEGDTSWLYVTAPADGYNVIAVGAVNASGTIAGFSSRGPTSDGRIKPEVVAMGVGCVLAKPSLDFGRGSGTSYACPLVSGTAALILSAHPQLTPTQVRQALIQTASQKTQPDNIYGFGLVDALQAVNYYGVISDPAETTRLVSVYPNPFSYSVHAALCFLLDLQHVSNVRIDLYNVLGQSCHTIIDTVLPASKERPVCWNGLTMSGRSLPSGLYFYRAYLGDYYKAGKITILQ